MSFERIKFDVSDGVARLTLNKPPLNVLDIAMMREISTALEGLSDDAGIKVLVFEAVEGSKAFSAGVDVSEHTADMVGEMIEAFHRIFRLLDTLDVPTLAVVGGAALGGGCELALFCDMVLASEKASFGQPEIQVGVFPPLAAVALPGIIGPKKAMELLLTGDRIRAGLSKRSPHTVPLRSRQFALQFLSGFGQEQVTLTLVQLFKSVIKARPPFLQAVVFAAKLSFTPLALSLDLVPALYGFFLRL